MSEPASFQVGDIVVYKLNPGPKMVVTAGDDDDDDTCFCQWWLSDGDWREKRFPSQSLTLVGKAPSQAQDQQS